MTNTFSWLNLSFLMIILSLVACRPEGINPTKCRDGKCTYTFSTNKAIEIVKEDSSSQSRFINIGSGSKRVFHYQYTANENPNIADDEYSENIYFEVNPDLDSFSFKDAELADAMLVVQPICFCPPVVHQPTVGSLSGQRQSNDTWEITLDIQYESYGEQQSISFTTKFEEK